MGDFTYVCIAICVIISMALGFMAFISLITAAFFFALKAVLTVLML